MEKLNVKPESKYIVSYDLRGDDRKEDYTKLEKELETEYNAKRLLQSVWGLSSELTYVQILTKIKELSFIKVGDGLLVIRVEVGRGSNLENKLNSF